MLYNGIFINSDKLIEIAYKLKQKNKKIEDCYKEIIEKSKMIDGTTENWQCKQQEDFYDALTYITNRYEKNVKKLTEIYNFLLKIIDDYENREKSFETTLNDNSESFDM